MAVKRFKSKVDWWVFPLFALIVIISFIALAGAVMEAEDPAAITATAFLSLIVTALLASVAFGTRYTVDRGTLRIRSGPLRWKIPVDEIQSVEPTRSPWSAPALSFDRLRINYGENHRILVSPADKAGFLQAIGHRADQ